MIDDLDRKLLAALQVDGRQTNAELSAHVGLSVSAVNERVRRLRRDGVIKSIRAIVDPEAVGVPVTAFIQVLVLGGPEDIAFGDLVADLPAVEEIHRIGGEYGFLLKVRARSLADLSHLISGSVMPLPGVSRCNTVLSFRTVKDGPNLPI